MFYGSSLFLFRVVLVRKRFRHLFTSSIQSFSFFCFHNSNSQKRTSLESESLCQLLLPSSTNLQSTQNVCCYALRYGGPERGLQTSSGSTGRLCLQVLPAPLHQGTHSPFQMVNFINFILLWKMNCDIQAYNLMIHERSHRDDVTYTCEVCGKTFKRQDNLKQHR